MVAILEKLDAAQGFEQIIDFLSGSYIHHALTVNPEVYISYIKQFWNTVVVKRSGDVTRLQALVDKKRIVISEEVVREILQLNDAEGKVFANMRRVGKGFLGVETPLFENMLADRAVDAEKEVQVPAQDDVVQEHVIEEISTEVVPPTSTSPSPSSPVLNKCYALVLRVEGLENANAAQQLEIIKLKARVKKLERLNKVKSFKLRRLKKVGTSQRVESLEDVENVFNQGRIKYAKKLQEELEKEHEEAYKQIDWNAVFDHFWNTAVVKRSGDVTRLQALVDKKRIVISEEVVRKILQLNDAEGVICLPNDEIFAGLARMGYEKPSTKLTFYKAFFSTQWKFFIHTILHSLSAKRTSWNEFSFAMASASICLSSGQMFNFSKVGKGFSGVETPLFENMLADRAVDAEEEVQVPAQDDIVQEHVIEEIATEAVPPTPTSPSPSSPELDKCSALFLRVEGLENANAAQQLEIIKLKARVKKLERLNKVKSSKLKRLKKVGTSQRVESSDEVENVFNQGRMSVDMEIDEGIELVVDQEKDAEVEGRQADTQAEIYNIDLDHSSKVAAASTPIPAAKPAAKPKILKIAAAAPVIDWNAAFDHVQAKETQYIKRYHRFKKKPQSESEARKNMISYLKNTERDGERRWGDYKNINETPTQKAAKRRKLSEEAQEADDLRGRLEIVPEEDDDVFVEAIPLAQKALVMDYQVVVIDNRPRYKIIRAVQLFLLVERRYPLSRFTLEQLVNVARLQVEEESDMSLELLRFTRQQLLEYQQG
nr:hypothetical protein [Tanacetum cinerariifolium]